MKKSIIAVLLLLIIVGSSLAFLFYKFPITGQVVNEYTYTSAICDKDNYCQDYNIQCVNGQAVKIDSLVGGVKHSKDWKDPRNETRLCV